MVNFLASGLDGLVSFGGGGGGGRGRVLFSALFGGGGYTLNSILTKNVNHNLAKRKFKKKHTFKISICLYLFGHPHI